MWTEMKTNQMRQPKAIYSELALAKESDTVTCILAETQRQSGEWENFTVEQKEGSGVP